MKVLNLIVKKLKSLKGQSKYIYFFYNISHYIYITHILLEVSIFS